MSVLNLLHGQFGRDARGEPSSACVVGEFLEPCRVFVLNGDRDRLDADATFGRPVPPPKSCEGAAVFDGCQSERIDDRGVDQAVHAVGDDSPE